ncbi:MAG: DUF86 domain-containing protein [Planctomycetota bacterium]
MQKLRAFREVPEGEFLREPSFHDLAERYLHLAAEACIDLANHWIADRGLPAPATNRDTFTTLEQAGELQASLAHRLRGWAGFRNVLVHGYIDVDHAVAYRAIQGELGDLEEFSAWALSKLSSGGAQ